MQWYLLRQIVVLLYFSDEIMANYSKCNFFYQLNLRIFFQTINIAECTVLQLKFDNNHKQKVLYYLTWCTVKPVFISEPLFKSLRSIIVISLFRLLQSPLPSQVLLISRFVERVSMQNVCNAVQYHEVNLLIHS